MTRKPRTTATEDAFLHLPAQSTNGELPAIVFFITGNPGLIGYYHKFLNLLCQPAISLTSDNTNGLDQWSPNPATLANCVIAGFSLGGFDLRPQNAGVSSPEPARRSPATDTGGTKAETDDDEAYAGIDDLVYPPGSQRKDIYGLRDQIELCYARLTALVARVRNEYAVSRTRHGSIKNIDGDIRHEGSTVKVVLMGHSVGAYIALELVRIHHGQTITTATDPISPPSAAPAEPTSSQLSRREPRFTIHQAILLTPTILNLSHSSSGRLATPLLSTLSFLPTLAQLGSNSLSGVLSDSWLEWLVGRVTGMAKGSDALATTVEFIRCRGAVRQALFLARDEMKEIGVNRWGQEVWGVVSGGSDTRGESVGGNGNGWTAPRLCFWFAKEDHWVADVTREEIVRMVADVPVAEGAGSQARSRARRPEVVVDEDGSLVHAWCIQQSEFVAQKVKRWLEEALLENTILI